MTSNLRVAIFGDDTHRPAITKAQIIGLVPVVLNVLAVYGIFTPSPAESDALWQLMVAGGALFGADALIRVGRNVGDGLKARAIVAAPATPDPAPAFTFTSGDVQKLVEALRNTPAPKPAARKPRAA